MSRRYPGSNPKPDVLEAPDLIALPPGGAGQSVRAADKAQKQYEFTGRLLEVKSSVEHQHHPENLAQDVALMAGDGWELVQVYVVPEPKHAMMGTAVDYGVYGLFRREKKAETVS
jgi:hypothetical protein